MWFGSIQVPSIQCSPTRRLSGQPIEGHEVINANTRREYLPRGATQDCRGLFANALRSVWGILRHCLPETAEQYET
jgi:hypothetical protein